MNVKEFKNLLQSKGLDAKTLTVSDLDTLINSNAFNDKEDVLVCLKYLIDSNQDNKTKVYFKNVYYMCLLGLDENIISTAFNGDDIEILKNKVLSFLNSEDPIFVLLAATCGMVTELFNFREQEQLLKENIKKMKNIIEEIGDDFSISYENYCSVLDTIFFFNNYYFQKNGVDLIRDEEWITTELDKLHKFENACIDAVVDDKYPVKGIMPEDLGYLDITKVEKED